MLRLADSWIWDSWFADDGRAYHVFFLKAPRRLGHPELRHFNVAIGHASSEDQRSDAGELGRGWLRSGRCWLRAESLSMRL